VVKSEEGKFYTIKYLKPPKLGSILKQKSCEHDTPEDHEDRASVFFSLKENETRDFGKNDEVNWVSKGASPRKSSPPSKTKDKPKKDKKGKGKGKGKGKNRRVSEAEAKEKERK